MLRILGRDDGTFVTDVTEALRAYLHHSESVIIKEVRGAFARNFLKEGRPTKWAQLAPSTRRERRAQGYGAAHPILVRSGDYRQSWINGYTETDLDDEQMKLHVEVGSEDIRVGLLEFGGFTAIFTYVPGRPVAELTEYDIAKLREALTEEAAKWLTHTR